MDDAQIAFAAVTAITRSASSTWKTIDPPAPSPGKVDGEFWFEHEKTFGVWRVLVKDHRAHEVEQIRDDGEDDDENEDDDKVVLSHDDRDFIKGLERAKIVLFLEDQQSIMCRDEESTGLLRETLVSCLTDGSGVDIDDVRVFMDSIDEVKASLERKGVSDFEMKVIAAGLV